VLPPVITTVRPSWLGTVPSVHLLTLAISLPRPAARFSPAPHSTPQWL
jgi:hypothetical protein